jgi:hypothetical protein
LERLRKITIPSVRMAHTKPDYIPDSSLKHYRYTDLDTKTFLTKYV